MIKRFLTLSVERRARLIIWLYHRYVVRPALKELEEMGMLVEFDSPFETWIEEDDPVLH